MTDSRAPAIRAEAIESLLIEKGLITAAAVDEVVERYNDRVRAPERCARRCPCLVRCGLQTGSAGRWHRGGRRRFAFDGGADRKTRRRGEHGERAQRGRVHVVLVLSVGNAGVAAALVQRSWRTARASCGNRGACSTSSVYGSTQTLKSGCGTRAPKCATSCCRNDRPGRTARRKPNSSDASRATR